MSDEQIIQHGAPTLAGLKTGNIFNCSYDDKDLLMKEIRRTNKQLRKKGLCIIPLRFSEHRALIYIYRPSSLSKDLSDVRAKDILRTAGYSASQNAAEYIQELTKRLKTAKREDFPHEIGLFLSYPPEDVDGFINNHASNKCTGTWKVYGDVQTAKLTFARYEKATRIYQQCWDRGVSLQKLAIAK